MEVDEEVKEFIESWKTGLCQFVVPGPRQRTGKHPAGNTPLTADSQPGIRGRTPAQPGQRLDPANVRNRPLGRQKAPAGVHRAIQHSSVLQQEEINPLLPGRTEEEAGTIHHRQARPASLTDQEQMKTGNRHEDNGTPPAGEIPSMVKTGCPAAYRGSNRIPHLYLGVPRWPDLSGDVLRRRSPNNRLVEDQDRLFPDGRLVEARLYPGCSRRGRPELGKRRVHGIIRTPER